MGLLRRRLGRIGLSVYWHPSANAYSGVDQIHDVLSVVDQESPVVFDVGANVGDTILDVLAHAPRARVVAFEPSPQTARTLRAKFERNRAVTVEERAMGDTEGTLPFTVTRAHSVNDSLLPTADEPDAPRVPVAVDTIDAYCARTQVARIDYLKIDTQGYDLRVLHGAEQMLRKRAIRVFSVEVMFRPVYEGQPTLLEMIAYIDRIGYEPLGFYDNFAMHGRLSHTNLACIPKRAHGPMAVTPPE